MKLLRHLEKLNKNNFFRIFKPIGAVLIGTPKASFCPNCSYCSQDDDGSGSISGSVSYHLFRKFCCKCVLSHDISNIIFTQVLNTKSRFFYTKRKIF